MEEDKKKQALFATALKKIEEHKLFFVEDLVSFLPVVKSTFYKYFPADSDEMNALKELLDDNKVAVKTRIRRKLYDSDKGADLKLLYQMICTPEERRNISGWNNMDPADSNFSGFTLTINRNDETLENDKIE